MNDDSTRHTTFDGRLFGTATAIGGLGLIAYAPALSSGSSPLKALTPFGALLLFASFLGAHLSNGTGFGAPLIESVLAGEGVRSRERSRLTRMAVLGVVVGAFLSMYELFVVRPIQMRVGVDVVADMVSLSLPVRFVGMPLYGGLTEEVFWRFGLMTFLAWLSTFVSRTEDGHPTNGGIWAANVLSAVGFAFIHLTPLFAANAVTPLSVGVTLAGICVFGALLGWCYCRYGLEASMTVHLVTNVVLVLVFSWRLGL
ncbi:type II CAAX prenyl endopeptidase Rce1 family protein [Haladaptatus sp. CMAA 1911]|uniref:CPBP family glutamic-type intramembrane protease n=1 Tax=unclassified Haladaptatus TaxID=2622732 RepID=UPI003754DBDC